MAQIGLNMGPHRAHILGWAVSFTKKLDSTAKINHDYDAIGVVSLFWAIIQACLPREVVDVLSKYGKNEELPPLATRNVKPGELFHNNSFNTLFNFFS